MTKNILLKGFCAFFLALLPLLSGAQTSCFLMHSSGNHLAKATDGGAVLEASDAKDPQTVTLIPTSDGYYNVQVSSGGYLSLSGQWNTSFIDDATADRAKYAIEKAGKSFIKLKCKYNGKYLGTDNTEASSKVYSDKSGTDTRHFWYMADEATQLPPIDTIYYAVNPSAKRQQFDGWGVSLCWWANMCGKWTDEKIDELVTWLVSPDGLNYRIFRYNIGGGDDPAHTNCTEHHMASGKGLRAEMEGFKDSTNGDYIWTRDEAQRKIMLKIHEKRPDAVFEAFSNSCPYYMTYSGCCSGNKNSSADNLKPEYYEEFAHYLVDVCKHYKDTYGIEFATLEPFNEPMTSYWGANGGQEGCHFNVASQIAFIKVLYPILRASGLNTVISASDETSVAQSVNDFNSYKENGIMSLVGQWNTHSYEATQEARSQISALCKDGNIRLWMSEVGAGGSGIAGNLNLAQKLIDDMRYIMPSAWVDWQYVEEGNDQWCLVRGNFAGQSYEKVKNYSVRQHFSKFIREGYTLLTSLNGQTLAARNTAGDSLVIVAINTNAADTWHRADLRCYEQVGDVLSAWCTTADEDMVSTSDYTLSDRVLTYKLPAYSIVTYIIAVKEPTNTSNAITDDGSYWICPRNAADLAVQTGDTEVTLQTVGWQPEQSWKITSQSAGYTFTNGNGDILTATNAYPLTFTSTAKAGQTFVVDSIDDIFCKISTEDGSKALDLENNRYTEGTRVGLWEYGTSPTATHRQWLIVRQPTDEGNNGIGHVAIDTTQPLLNIRLSVIGENTLQIENLESATCSLRIYAANGRCVYDTTLSSSVSLPLAPGIYLVCCHSATASFCRSVLVQ